MSLTYIEKLLEELVGQVAKQNELLETLLIKSFPDLQPQSPKPVMKAKPVMKRQIPQPQQQSEGFV